MNESTVKPVAERLLFSSGTRGFEITRSPSMIVIGSVIRVETKKRTPIEDDFACIGDIVFISPMDGRYTHCEEDGTVIIDGEMHGFLRKEV